MIKRLAALLAALVLAGAASNEGRAAPKLEDRQDELDSVRGRLQSLRKNLAKDEATHQEAADQLREVETTISQANRALRELSEEHRAAEAERQALDNQRRRLEADTGVQQRQLERLLNRQFVGGDADALKLLLAGSDPNQAARDSYFLNRLSVAKAALIKQLNAVAKEKQRLAAEAQRRSDKLAIIEKQQTEQRAKLLKDQQKRQTLLAQIAARVKTQRKEIGTLQRNEQRLAQLIDDLVKKAAERAKAREREKASKPATPPVDAGGTAKAGQPAQKIASPTPGKAPKDADPGRLAGAFGSLRGKLTLPVNGEIAGRFGSVRADGDASSRWKGLFIRAAEGLDVRAVAAGTVVFAEWLRGFGNLIIVDHDDDFLSIYAYNQSLLRQPGDTVKAGQAVATVGNSGGGAQSGLYFELRHRGQPFDPAKWLRR